MNYYQHHIGDFIRDTARLSDTQTMAYLRLLWRYYESEEPLADDADMLAFTIGSDADTVRLILRCFFKLENGAWHQSRCDREIANYHKKAEAARENGKNGGRPKKNQREPSGNPVGYESEPSGNPVGTQQEPSSNPAETGSKANHKPVTINQEPSNKSSSEQSPDAPKPSRKKFGTPEDREAAEWMFERIKSILPSAKPPSMEAWANDVRLMREQDGRTHREICELFGWANRDSFWSANILSPAKLRDKWTQLCAQRNRPVQSVAQPINKQQAQEDRNRAALANWRPPELRGDSYERG